MADSEILVADGARNGDGQRLQVSVVLTGEQAAAVEGWRAANRVGSQSDAVRELVRIGLLSEIGRIYRMISLGRGVDPVGEDDGAAAEGEMQ